MAYSDPRDGEWPPDSAPLEVVCDRTPEEGRYVLVVPRDLGPVLLPTPLLLLPLGRYPYRLWLCSTTPRGTAPDLARQGSSGHLVDEGKLRPDLLLILTGKENRFRTWRVPRVGLYT